MWVRQTDRQISALSITAEMSTERAACWSVTINNPTSDDISVTLPVGWSLKGQHEKGKEGTEHFQGMLKTPQVRFSAVKKVFPRAHIEVARNATALSQYVNKEETRVAAFGGNETPTIFQYQDIIAGDWNDADFVAFCGQPHIARSGEDPVLAYVDKLASKRIAEGAKGLEFISVNPIWRSSWKRFAIAIIERHKNKTETTNITDAPPPSQEVQSPPSPPRSPWSSCT